MGLKKVLFWAVTVAVVLFFGAAFFSEQGEVLIEVEPAAPSTFAPLVVPAERSFHLAMVPWPAEFSQEGILEAMRLVGKHADMITHHFDRGVPWVEASEGGSYSTHVQRDLQARLDNHKPGQKIFVTIAAQASERNTLANYWGSDYDLPLPKEWQEKYFDDPEVVEAYLNWARHLIQTFNPDYFAYGIEVNSHFGDGDNEEYVKFLGFAEEIYTTLKKENPELPIFVTLASIAEERVDELQIAAKKVLPYSDYVALSTYPYLSFHKKIKRADPNEIIADDWLTSWADLAPEKPFAISETAWPAEKLIVKPLWDIEGKESWQADYLELLFTEVNTLNGEFINWFIPKDYDAGYRQMVDLGMTNEFLKTWKDTGLLDGQGRERQGLRVWRAWLEDAPLKTESSINNK